MGFVIPESPVAAIEEGIWVEYEGSSFLVAYATNPKFLRSKQRLEQPHRRKIESGNFDPVDQRNVLIKAMAEGILIGWKNVKNPDGDEVPFSKEAAIKALMFDEVFREYIMESSINIQNYRASERDISGNS